MKTQKLLFIALIFIFASCQSKKEKIIGKWLNDDSESEKITYYEYKIDSSFVRYEYKEYSKVFEKKHKMTWDFKDKGKMKWYINNDTLYREGYTSVYIQELNDNSLVYTTKDGKYEYRFVKTTEEELTSGLNELLKRIEERRLKRIEGEKAELESKIDGLYESPVRGGFYVDQIKFGNGIFEVNLEAAKLEFTNPLTRFSGTYKIIDGHNLDLYYNANNIGSVSFSYSYSFKSVDYNSIAVYIVVNKWGQKYKFYARKK